jgi:carboxylesterase type B
MTPSSEKWLHLNTYEKRYLKQVIKTYDKIMMETQDIQQIATEYKVSIEEVKRAKNHAFGEGVSSYEFSPSPDMADAWLRISSGKATTLDEVLLRHEIYESDLVINQGLKQSDAHKLAQEKYPWSDFLIQSKKDN